MRGKHFDVTDEAIGESVKRFKGNVSAAAKACGVSRSCVKARVENSEMLKQVVSDERETMLDVAEATLQENILNGKETSLIFFLKTQGYRRGYGRQAHYDPDHPEDSGNKIIIVDRRGEISKELAGTGTGNGTKLTE